MYTHILLATDGSDNALKATEIAAELARASQAKLSVLHVTNSPLPVLPYADAAGMGLDYTTFNQYLEEMQKAVAERTTSVLKKADVPYTLREEIGNPAEVIARIANEEKNDLIVLGSRGLSSFQSFLLGSVSDRVLHHAHCSVLVVR